MKTLGELAKEYARGQLAKADYRRHRTDLIQGIIKGDIEVQDYSFEPPLPPPDEDITEQSGFDPLATTQLSTVPNYGQGDSEKKTPVASAEQRASAPAQKANELLHQKKLMILSGLTLMVLLIVLVLSFILLRSGDETTEIKTEVSSPLVGQQISSADKLISNFLNENKWQQDNLNSFTSSWLALDSESRQNTTDTGRLAQLGNAIYKKILEEKALMSLGDESKSLERQRMLADFATSLGIKDQRIISQVPE